MPVEAALISLPIVEDNLTCWQDICVSVVSQIIRAWFSGSLS